MKIRNILIASAIFVSLCSGKAMAADNINTSMDRTNLLITASTTNDGDIKVFPERTDVAIDKKWTLKFNKQLNSQAFKKDNIQVLDSNGQAVSVTVQLNSDNMLVDVLPPSSNYTNGQTYSIVVKKSLLSKDNIQLSKEARMKFTIVKSSSGNSSSSGGTNTNVNPALIEAKNVLPKVQELVKTQAEKNLVSTIRSAIDAKISNPSTVTDTASIKAKYYSLSPDEQADFKNALMGNFTIGTLLQLRSLFQ
ncbi:hypothetical protein HBE96_21245 [Clostridium sp. P21]|uniref:SbsA Ig-like domain-containing protein n=1 Tax=Clostridium muellerianum TaxID=2716538 RepID=A0A7Y0HPJ8_9CLOT|nr:Ig-like domain-containing protein [Clostridium muellerianum]NMM65114.1 hypothetical protein [Clostridium muellerianum]